MIGRILVCLSAAALVAGSSSGRADPQPVAADARAPAAQRKCPDPVVSAVKKGYPGATLESCRKQTEDGRAQYTVTIATPAGKRIDLDIGPDGSLLQTEERIDAAALPAAVMEALKGRAPGAKIERADKITMADGKVLYEVAYRSGSKLVEDTFTEAGAFVESE